MDGRSGGLVQTVSIYNNNPRLATMTPSPAAQPVWKLPKKPRKKRRTKIKMIDDKQRAEAEKISVDLVTEKQFKVQDSDFMSVQVCFISIGSRP